MQADQPYGNDQPATPDPTNHPSNTNIPDPLYQPRNYKNRAAWDLTISFLFDYAPRQIYLHLLLRLPSVYFSRVAAIFEEAALSLSDIQRMTLQANFDHKGMHHDPYSQASTIRLRYNQLDETWNSFVNSLLRDWNTYNIVSALILSAILTILQIDAAAQDPLIRYTLLFSQLCAVTSLLLGCLYSIRFDSSMRKTYKAAQWVQIGTLLSTTRHRGWAQEAQRTRISVWWNIWVLLAMPAIWLAWSAIFYIIAIMSFVWRTAPSASPPPPPVPLSAHTLLFIRILLTLVLALGVTSGWLSLLTFHRYGYAMDRTWERRIDAWQAQYRTGVGVPASLDPSPNLNSSDEVHGNAESDTDTDTTNPPSQNSRSDRPPPTAAAAQDTDHP